MIKRRIVCLVLAFTGLLCGLGISASGITTDDNTLQCIGLDAQTSFLGNRASISNAKSVILYETNSDILMYAQNADDRIYPASFVKMMTALVAIEQGRLTDSVVVKEEILNTVSSGAVSVDLQADEIITLKDLLYCMMVASANDAAAVIAAHICGSIPDFVTVMNQRAEEIGCTDTVFTNVHGLHDDDQYSTARDIAKILAAATENEQFMEVFSTVYYDVPATNKSDIRYLASGNYLMNKDDVQIYYDSRVTGSRTGVDTNGFRCLATTASANDMDYICVVTGSRSVYEKDGYTVRSFGGYNETKSLLDLGFNGNTRGQVFFKGQSVKQEAVINGENDVILGAATDMIAIVPNDADLEYRYQHQSAELRAPIEQGQILSSVEVWCNGMCIAQTELYAMNSVQVAGASFSITEGDDGWYDTLVTILAVALATIIAGCAGAFALRKLRAKASARPNRRQRRLQNEE